MRAAPLLLRLGVVSLLPWFLGMSVVGGADAPGTTPVRGSSNRPTIKRPGGGANRPGSRPGPARPGTRTGAPAGGGAGPTRGQGPGTTTTSNGRLQELYRWKRVDYDFPDEATRAKAVANGDYNPDNNLPLGVEAYKDRIFVSIPRWKPGVPATLAYVSRYPEGNTSPKLKPYPDWSWHRVPRAGQNDSCQALTSVFRMTADECGRLWVIDSGAVDAIGDIRVVCPPQIVIFDLKTDRLLWRYVIPKSQTKPESLFTNIVVDIRDGQCDDAFAYAADVFRYGLLVYSWREDRSYRLTHNLFFPDPIAARFVLDNTTFRWMDGIFGLALSPIDKETGDRTMFFHPMASFREFAVQTSVIRNETFANDNPDEFKLLGARGRNQSHSSASAMDRRGVLFFNLVTQDALGCWDSAKPYGRSSVGHVAQDSALLNFPNDLKVDREEPQNIWLLSNRLHLYLYRSLSPDEYNFRILTGTVEKATEGTICDPLKIGPKTSVPKEIDACEDL
ncbi:protein yellow-like isoform X2 [Frankliniella occidentalis]|uniref:Protein yellow-like isoform X2 n=1 Tax=Frankliniella occidentalis TaxID=133901 RepID=A0A9C6X936_FRAOC|nr:protein yellow-like isoform X2 [Frankliniella occidentalis]